MLKLEDFRGIVEDKTLAEIYARARGLYGKHIVHVNSTYMGGGVAEILYSLVMLMNDVGIDTGWRIVHGTPDFFEITKSFHNALQGADIELTEDVKQLYLQVNESYSKFAHLDHDCVVVHDPQPLALIRSYRKRQPWIWRCHIDLTKPHAELWDFLKGFILKYDQVVVSSEKYLKEDLPIDQRLLPPAINPLNYKNMDLSEEVMMDHIKKAGIPSDKPLITQVSRLDPWKDPSGVIDIFEVVKEKFDCRLLFCYNLASDDPEGVEMYQKTFEKAKKHVEKGDILFIVGNNDLLVNAIQKFSDVIIQKSIKEGFCLSVTEALWKQTPVVASNVGGIPLQIVDSESGFLLDPQDIEGFADRIIHILKNPDAAKSLGHKAKEKVRKEFLITRLLSNHLDMYNAVINQKS